jgi:hypothetical protein
VTTWNPADKSADITLSNGDLTAQSNGSGSGFYSIARSMTSKSAGKVYFEVTAGARTAAGDYAAIGLATATSVLDEPGNLLGTGANDDTAYYADGNVWFSGNNTPLSAYGVGAIIGCAIDLSAGKGWFSLNGVFESGDPAAGTGEHFTFTAGASLFASFNFLVGGTDTTTANFGATAFNASPPTGFSAWDVTAPIVVSTSAPLTYGAAPHALAKRRDYEAQVRAHWERIEAAERQERELIAELERQQAEIEAQQAEAKLADAARAMTHENMPRPNPTVAALMVPVAAMLSINSRR